MQAHFYLTNIFYGEPVLSSETFLALAHSILPFSWSTYQDLLISTEQNYRMLSKNDMNFLLPSCWYMIKPSYFSVFNSITCPC